MALFVRFIALFPLFSALARRRKGPAPRVTGEKVLNSKQWTNRYFIPAGGIDKLEAFAKTEFYRLQGGYDAGRLAISVRQVRRYWCFLTEKYCGHASTAQLYRQNHAVVMTEVASYEPGKDYHVSAEQEAVVALTAKLDLEVQSFYIFAKIMLANVAQTIELYFGAGPHCSLQSHDKLRRCFTAYRDQKGLEIPPGFSEVIKTLQKTIVDHRDKEYKHLRQARLSHMVQSVQITQDAEVIVGQGPLAYPDLRSEPAIVNAEPLRILLGRLDALLSMVAQLLESNSARTQLTAARLNPTPA